jgi:hypothetical protein
MFVSKTNMVKKGTVAHPSSYGYYNFQYPDLKNECTFSSDAIVNKLSWGPQEGLVAVTVAGSFLLEKDFRGDKKHIVWINPSDILSY